MTRDAQAGKVKAVHAGALEELVLASWTKAQIRAIFLEETRSN